MKIARILFPVDFSPNCEKAAGLVTGLAAQHGSEVDLLHVMEPAEHLFTMLEANGALLEDLRQEWTQKAQTRLHRFLADQLPTASRTLVEGDPGMEICRAADERNASLIVMPTHGFSLMRRFVLGSVTARVLHDAHCPVLTAMPDAEPHEVKSVVCAIDLREQSERALRFAAGLVPERLTIVHATPVVSTPVEGAMAGDLTERITHDARMEIRKLADRLNVKATICVHAGEPEEVIRRAIESHRGDLLVIARGAVAGGLGRLRAHSYGIINQAPCPVVSV